MARAKSARSASDTASNLGFEAMLWLAADKLRNNMDAAEFKHLVRVHRGLAYADIRKIISTYPLGEGRRAPENTKTSPDIATQ